LILVKWWQTTEDTMPAGNRGVKRPYSVRRDINHQALALLYRFTKARRSTQFVLDEFFRHSTRRKIRQIG
jgi:hypothetical protein